MAHNHIPFGFEKPEDSPGFLLWQTTTVWQRLIKKELEKQRVSHSQFVIMACLLWAESHSIEATQTFIINSSKLDKMTVSKSLKALKHMELINRIEHKIDTRAKQVSLTEKGKVLICTLAPIVEKIDEQFFGTNAAQVVAILSKLMQS